MNSKKRGSNKHYWESEGGEGAMAKDAKKYWSGNEIFDFSKYVLPAKFTI